VHSLARKSPASFGLQQDPEYTLVGDASISGRMDGEIMEMKVSSRRTLESFESAIISASNNMPLSSQTEISKFVTWRCWPRFIYGIGELSAETGTPHYLSRDLTLAPNPHFSSLPYRSFSNVLSQWLTSSWMVWFYQPSRTILLLVPCLQIAILRSFAHVGFRQP